ncbi:MAG: hypothetical protein AB1634_05315 [Thermodesulfobacteriota bacterium]
MTAERPTALALDAAENLYVVETGRNRLQIVGTDGRTIGLLTGLDRPVSVAVDSRGRIYVGNNGRGNVEVYNRDLQLLHKLGAGDQELARPAGLGVTTEGKVYVADGLANTVKVYDAGGAQLFSFGEPGGGEGQLHTPTALAIDEGNGRVLVADLPVRTSRKGSYEAARVQAFDLAGRFLQVVGDFGVGEGSLIKPLGLAVDGAGRILVADAYENVVQVFDHAGVHQETLYDGERPLRTALGVAYGLETERLFVASHKGTGVAVFGLPETHTIAVETAAGGTISPFGLLEVFHGMSQEFRISPDPGYAISQVLVDSVGVGPVASYTLTKVVADHTIAARFEPKIYAIQAAATGGGTISPAGSVEIGHGGRVVFSVQAADDHHVAQVLVDGADVGPVSEYEFSAVDRGHTIEAVFAPSLGHTIAATAGVHGTISPTGAVRVPYGEEQAFTISPDTGYTIAAVLVDGRAVGAPASYTFPFVTADHTIEATFAESPVEYRLAVEIVGRGSVQGALAGIACPEDCSEEYRAGTEVSLVAVPADGWRLVGWGEACAGDAAMCTVTMEGTRAVTARFLPATAIEDFERGDLAKLPWLTGGTGAWAIEEEVTRGGRYAVAAPLDLGAGESSFLEVTLEVESAGELSFWHRESTAADQDYLRLLIDGEEHGNWSGEDSWSRADVAVAPGRHTLRWEYVRGAGAAAGANTVWLDDIAFPAFAHPVYPVADLKANCQDGPLVLRRGERLQVSAGLAAGGRAGENADWFVELRAHRGWYAYNLFKGSWRQGFGLSWLGALSVETAAHDTILETAGLPPGLYGFYFLVDTTMNGKLDQPFSYDCVWVSIEE